MKGILDKHLGRIKYFKISYLALLTMSLSYELYIILLAKNIRIIEFLFNLKLVFVSSLIYCLGIAIYNLFYPLLIRKYYSEKEYIRDNIDEDLISEKELNIVLTHLSNSQAATKKRITIMNEQLDKTIDLAEKIRLRNDIDILLDMVYIGSLKWNLLNEYSETNRKYKIMIRISSSLYLIAVSILIYVLYIGLSNNLL